MSGISKMPNNEQFMPYLALAGNIGVGKTTMTTLLAERLNWTPWYEPVINNPYLDDFYADMHRWSFHLQIYFLSKRFEAQRKILSNPKPSIQDRTIYEDVFIFAKTLHRKGFMTDREFENYSSLFSCMIDYLRPPDAIIYLRAPVEVVYQRIQKRGRESEKSISIDYLDELHQAYEEWSKTAHLISTFIPIDTVGYEDDKLPKLCEFIIQQLKTSTQLSLLDT
ncbi:MAG: deoxynucleoside kinase [bacterium]|nr:deoxynucleoside kinase [bacterium]